MNRVGNTDFLHVGNKDVLHVGNTDVLHVGNTNFQRMRQKYDVPFPLLLKQSICFAWRFTLQNSEIVGLFGTGLEEH